MAYDDESWEHTHGLIQWIFPSGEPSNASRSAPVLSGPEIVAIGKSDSAQAGLNESVERYQRFCLRQ